MQIEQTATTDLIPYVSNSRTHSEGQVAQIAASIKEFGFNNPILVDKEKGIIAGHGRVLAARKLGMDKVPTVELSHLTETQRKAYIIADNKLALNADWSDELLAIELGGLGEAGFDLTLLGWGDGLPEFADAPDYSVLEDEDLENQLNQMTAGVKKAVQIEFDAEHYEEAQELIKFWRSKNRYIGMMLIEKLRSEKKNF